MYTQHIKRILINLKRAFISTAGRGAPLALVVVLVSQLCAGTVQSQAQTDQPQTKKNNITRGFKIIEGDIQVPEEFSPTSVFTTQLWTNGIVPFQFDANVTQANRNAMLAAMAEWEGVANVDFRPRQGEANHIHIQDSTVNNSAVGMVGGQQIMNITSWGARFVMAHELGHALGLFHEHSRPGRNSFVRINTNNIQAGRENQFEQLNSQTPAYGYYDFDSVMHYGQCAFSRNTNCPTVSAMFPDGGITIAVLPPYDTDWQNNIGQRTRLSYLDQTTMSFLYPFGNWRFVDRNYSGVEDGSFRRPFRSFFSGVASVPVGGTLWVQPGSYAAVGVFNKRMTIRAPLGGVTLGTGN